MSVIQTSVQSPNVAPVIGPFSQGVRVGNTLYISGQIGMTLEGELLQGLEAQTRQALENVSHVVSAAGGTLDNVVKTTVLFSDLSEFEVANKIYREFFSNVLPARAAYQVSVLPRNALIEVEAVAVLGNISDA